MKLFLGRFLFVGLVFFVLFVNICSMADGKTDPFYLRFTTPTQDNLIVGTSRAAHGLQPEVFDSILNKDIYNFAFSIAHSPYGPTYLKKIKSKINEEVKSGVFIVAIDPWSISSRSTQPNDYSKFRELKLCLGNTSSVTLNPNVEYLLKNFDGQYLSLLSDKDTGMFLHDDGWLELSIKMDSVSMNVRLNKTVENYRTSNLKNYHFSSYRMEYLMKTIEFLKHHGKVYVVRLPIHKKMMDIENLLMPDFDQKMARVIDRADGYYDFTGNNDDFTYIDGNHLFKVSGRQVSMEIANLISDSKFRK